MRAGDEPFLLAVYASTRADELALVEWTPEQKEAFVAAQFAAQTAHYQAHYEATTYDVVLADGAPAGRLTVARWPQEIRIVDLALLPRFRGAGVGTALVGDLMREAAAHGKRVTVHVERHNRARELYARLGFTPVGEAGVHLLMELRPDEGADQVKMAS